MTTNLLKNRLKRFLEENSSRKTLIIINSRERIRMIAEAIEPIFNKFAANTEILCFKTRKSRAFRNFHGKVKILDDYLTCEDHASIDDYVFNDISKNWDKEAATKFKDVFIYRGVELARISEYGFQLFLLIKIKALTAITKAIEGEGYKAAFIIDYNGEHLYFDGFLKERYGIPVFYAGRINRQKPVVDLAREKASLLISRLIDIPAALLIQRNKGARLIDARLFYKLDLKDKDKFILAPLEKGLKLRLRSIFERRGYIAFDLKSDAGKRFGNFLWSPKKSFDIQNLTGKFIFKGIPYWKVVEEQIKTIIYIDFARFRRNMDILTDLCNANRIECAILRNDVREVEKTIVLLAKSNNVPTLVIQHGILAEVNGHNTVFADKVAVWGNRAMRWYEKFGNDPSKMAVVGSRSLDRAFGRGDFDKRKTVGIKPHLRKRRLITLFTTGVSLLRQSSFMTDDLTENIIDGVTKAIKSIGNADLIIKLHPNECISTFADFISREYRDAKVIRHEVDVYKIIGLSDLVITMDSTVGLEAAIMKKPLIVINLSKRPDLLPYVEKNVAVGAYKTEDIESVIKKALYDDNVKRNMDLAREDFINDFAYKTNGKARERMSKLIEEVSLR